MPLRSAIMVCLDLWFRCGYCPSSTPPVLGQGPAERPLGRSANPWAHTVIAAMEGLHPRSAEPQDFLGQSLGYFRDHAHRMNYAELRAQGYFIGSGTIESACKHVVSRLKGAGMKWSPPHVARVLALRVSRASGWWERFWRDRARSAAA